jgi:hypothetical protein
MTVAPRYAAYGDAHDTGILAPVLLPRSGGGGGWQGAQQARPAAAAAAAAPPGGQLLELDGRQKHRQRLEQQGAGGPPARGAEAAGRRRPGAGGGEEEEPDAGEAAPGRSGPGRPAGRAAAAAAAGAVLDPGCPTVDAFTSLRGPEGLLSAQQQQGLRRTMGALQQQRQDLEYDFVRLYLARDSSGVDRVFVDHPVYDAACTDDRSALRVTTYRAAGALADPQRAYSVLSQAALAAPLLLWTPGLAASLGLQPGGAAGGPSGWCIVHGVAVPLEEAQQRLARGGALRGRARSAGAGAGGKVLPAAAAAAAAAAAGQAPGTPAGPPAAGQAPAAGAGAGGPLLFVGNDWPCAPLPLWIKAHAEGLLDAPAEAAEGEARAAAEAAEVALRARKKRRRQEARCARRAGPLRGSLLAQRPCGAASPLLCGLLACALSGLQLGAAAGSEPGPRLAPLAAGGGCCWRAARSRRGPLRATCWRWCRSGGRTSSCSGCTGC